MGKYNSEDAWEDIEDFYGDGLETKDEEFINKVHNQEFTDSRINNGNSNGDILKSIIATVTDVYGNSHEMEILGRIDAMDKTYIIVHRIDDPDPSTLSALRAWDDENGEMHTCDIDDEKEYEEVARLVDRIMHEDSDATEVGGILWDDGQR